MGPIHGSEIVGVIEDAVDCAVAGWAYDPSTSTAIELSLLVDGEVIETKSCDLVRGDVLKGGFGRERVGFQFRIPATYCDGLPHFVQLRAADGKSIRFLNRDGVEQDEWIFLLPQHYLITQLDTWLGRDVHCWAIVVDRLSGEKCAADHIIVRQSGKKVATLYPTISRPDVAAQFDCNPVCGFVLPYKKLKQLANADPIQFVVAPGGAEIVGSPLVIGCGQKDGLLDSAYNVPASSGGSDGGLQQAEMKYAPIEEPLDISSTEPVIQLALLRESGLFDQDYYIRTYPDVAGADMPLFEHFFDFGFREGRRPNHYFEPLWYQEQNPEIATLQIHPLMHFFLLGDRNNRDPGPLFNVKSYRERYNISESDNTLAHYLKYRFERPLSPLPDFDADYYAQRNPDVFSARVDMFDHFFSYGYKECRNPSAKFDVKFYVQRYLNGDFTSNPFLHFWAHRDEPGVFGRFPDDEVTVSREMKRFCRPGPLYEDPIAYAAQSGAEPLLLAYYLPQFHAFPENDEWWGKGFTEWTNLVRGSPRFIGHYQPRIPRDLGFYTLDSVEPMRAQIKMATAAGVAGFVFYYYWFNGKRLMDQPVWRYLADSSLNIKFCLMWANENWTRRWDGAEQDVLISQDYRQDDDLAMAKEFSQHFRDARYIRVQGRPLLMIYRPDVIPDVHVAIQRWRDLFRSDFGEDPIFVMAQAFNSEDPSEFGFDGAIEFPPHKLTTYMAPKNTEFTYLDPDFAGNIHKYDDVVEESLRAEHPDFPLIKTAVPSWDNDARRQGTGLVITGSTPAKYEAWLRSLCSIAKQNPFFGQPIVCVNAWNEWCEGAYLEPDIHFGSAYLNATARALGRVAKGGVRPRILLVGHDAFSGGAQHLLLHIGRVMAKTLALEFEFLLLGHGNMLGSYESVGPTTVVTSDDELSTKLQNLKKDGFTGAIVNTSACGRATAYLRVAGIEPIFLIHELPRLLREKNLTEFVRVGFANSSKVVFSAPYVRDRVLAEIGGAPDDRTVILPQGSYKNIKYDALGGRLIRKEFMIDRQDVLILGVGYADLRKGFDLFLQIWRLSQLTDGLKGRTRRVHFMWVGGIDPGLQDWMSQEIHDASGSGTFHMAGYREDMAAIFSAASAFALTSREDPLPTVVMEAIGAGLPVVAFEKSGGIPDLMRQIGEGTVVAYGDANAMASALIAECDHEITPHEREERGVKIQKYFDFDSYVRSLVKIALPEIAQISVVVPNFNYANYMPDRLASIFRQNYPVHEVIVLDDCSVDNSIDVINAVAESSNRTVNLIVNRTNSGSVFRQWRRAAETATGEFLWIAEADDLSDPDFLASTVEYLAADPNVQFVFSDSRTVDADGRPQWESYKGYYSTLEPGALAHSEVFESSEFVGRFLAVKNLILNVSAVVWRRDALLRALNSCSEQLLNYRMAGDWLLYITALSVPGARVGYQARPLNVHRRHAQSVTHSLDARRHIQEIGGCQAAAAELFPLSNEVSEKQKGYLSEVEKQLMNA